MLHYNLGEQYPQLLATQQRKRYQQHKSRHLQEDDQALLLQQPPQSQQQHQSSQQQQQPKKPVRIFRVHYIRLNSKDGCGGLNKSISLTNLSTSSGGATCGGIGATNATTKMKTIAPNIRRRRRCDKHHLELAATAAAAVTSIGSAACAHGASISMPASVCSSATTSTATSPIEDIALPAPPITPPPAFLSAGYKRSCTTSPAAAPAGTTLSARATKASVKMGGTAAAKSSAALAASGSKAIRVRRLLGM
ncbi:uncharacterized protein LOC128862434 [Anastrepha ludens]|uniref:uncharacterized protein LOC128862434 n=1 Tax=Anastrepha ludens TaxID=28586 RepID=UPI0023AFB1B2|nr:uncharacterized protein LOC128862434 [Anastrepha ludens]XP_053957019.1 uncharacterized protein LOC128862434 [Anastrepha ludens]XP_053957020.1 uncharacterized protein LOC128862434 [Anastrepha ludens]XP_053957022.1 uncharacterized protein LOC128862434 [Anastrepha ludens]XP_053957023.1 uncharacterized protein LOC128862434 [Anastrepha ludens]XP_053957024.1 uncharacterized protein LOC128862434 [Anastrepha ludens]